MSKCTENGCDKYASFGLPDGPKIKCAAHRSENLIQKKKPKECQFEGCNKTALFGLIETNEKKFCSIHKTDQMINLNNKLCKIEGCKKYALYGEQKKEYCKDHKDTNMINCNKKYCKYKDCKKTALFSKTGKNLEYCGDHKTDDMIPPEHLKCIELNCKITGTFIGKDKKRYCINHVPLEYTSINTNKCIGPECNKQPTFGYEGQKAITCKIHKTDVMVDLCSKLCSVIGCQKNVSYGFSDGNATRCKEHVEEGMIDVKHNRCYYKDCNIIPSFGYIDGTAISCKQHKKPEMMHKNKTCDYNNCDIKPTFGRVDEKPIRCQKHKEADMIDLVSKKCYFDGCNKNPSLGYEQGKPISCLEHKKENMFNVKDKKCDNLNCQIIATFNYINECPLKCKIHALPGMIDVTAIRCSNCDTIAGFGLPGNPATSCAKHKTIGMISHPSKKCTAKNCNNPAIYGIKTQIHCEDHKKTNEYNLIEKECSSCKLLMILNDKNLCGFCDTDMIKTFKLYKQNKIKQLLDTKKYKYQIYDRVVDSNCGLERPDFVFDCTTHFVVLEVDENAHNASNYKKQSDSNYTCEEIRMINISQALGMKTIFIRYNPDDYKVNGVKSKISENKRQLTLLKYLDRCRKMKTSKLSYLSVMYLFYEGFDEKKLSLSAIKF